MSDVLDKWVSAYHRAQVRYFRKLGVALANHAHWFFLSGVVMAAVCIAGLYNVHEVTLVEDLWRETGGRMDSEKAFYDAHFGGIGRGQSFIMKSRAANGIGSAAFLDSLLELMTPIVVENEPDPIGVLRNPNQLQFSGDTVKAGVGVITEKDLCESQSVPDFVLGPGQLIAALIVQISQCLNTTGDGSRPVTPLPTGWGLDRFPCSRVTVLDCFAEGAFDYPTAFLQYQSRGMAMATHPNITSCITTAASTIASPGNPYFDVLYGGLFQAIDAFKYFGHFWKPSYKGMTDREITEYIYNSTVLLSDPAVNISVCIRDNLPCCTDWSGSKMPWELHVGGFEFDESGKVQAIRATQFALSNVNEDNPTWVSRFTAKHGHVSLTSAERTKVADGFERTVINYLLPIREALRQNASATYDVEFQLSRSIDDVVEEGTRSEGDLITIAVFIVVGWLGLTSGTCWRRPWREHLVNSGILLSFLGACTIVVGLIASFGFCGWVGVGLTPLNTNVVPFLGLAIGVVEVFVLMRALSRRTRLGDSNVENIIAVAWEVAGPSVLLTCASNAVAFFITVATPIPMIEKFCVHMGIAVICNFVALVTLFGPCMVWDVRRRVAGRLDVCLCIVVPITPPAAVHTSLSPESNMSNNPGQSPFSSPPEATPSAALVSETPQASTHPVKRADEDRLTVFARTVLAPVLMKLPVRIFVLVGFCLMFALFTWNSTENTVVGLPPQDITLKGSYQNDFLVVNNRYFPTQSGVLVSRCRNMSLAQQGMLDAQDALQETEHVVKSLKVSDASWLSIFLSQSNPDGSQTPLPVDKFQSVFTVWASQYGIISNMDMYCEHVNTGARVDCSAEGAIITASRVVYVQRNLITTKDYTDCLTEERRAVDAVNAKNPEHYDFFTYGTAYQYWEQYLHSMHNVLVIAGYTLLGVFIATLLFQFNPVMSVILVSVKLMIHFESFGMLQPIGAKLNGFSLANLIIAIGLSVEFTAHVAREFLLQTGTRKQRVEQALVELFAPVTYGALCSFLPLIPLAFAKFPFFRLYYFGLYSLMVLFTWGNGVFFLPVVLSFIGPAAMDLEAGGKEVGVELTTLSPEEPPKEDCIDVGNPLPTPHGRP